MISRPSQHLAVFQGVVSLANQEVSYLNSLQNSLLVLASHSLFNRCALLIFSLSRRMQRWTELSVRRLVRLFKTDTCWPTSSVALRPTWACRRGEAGCDDAVRALSRLSAQRHCGFLSCLQCAVSKFTLGVTKGHGTSDYLGVYPWLAVTRQSVPASKCCRMFQHWPKGWRLGPEDGKTVEKIYLDWLEGYRARKWKCKATRLDSVLENDNVFHDHIPLASLTQWTWVWTSSGSWWWTGRPGMLQSMGSQRLGHDWVTELNWTEVHSVHLVGCV